MQALQTASTPADLGGPVVAILLVVHPVDLRVDHQARLRRVLLGVVVVAVLQQPIAMLHLEAW